MYPVRSIRTRANRAHWLSSRRTYTDPDLIFAENREHMLFIGGQGVRIVLDKAAYEGMGKPKKLQVVVIADDKGILANGGSNND